MIRVFFAYSVSIFSILIFSTSLYSQTNKSKEYTNENLLWPIKQEKFFTSNFMEDRPGRFHAGLDFRTFGRNLPLYAIEDGYVSRINVSPWGYGRAIYVKGKSGKTYVYGHTDSFVGKVDSLVLANQYANMRYRVNFYPTMSQCPVKKGDLIAYSGNTGIGPNHLHFEIRDANMAPINPELLGYTVDDSVKPQLRKIVITPLTDSSTINNSSNIQSFSPTEIVDDTINFTGEIGISVAVYDMKSNNEKNKLGVYKYLMMCGKDTLFYQENNFFSYEDAKYSYKDRNYSYPTVDGVRCKNLYRSKNNYAKFYSWAKLGDGIFNSSNEENIKKISIFVYDFMNNEVKSEFFLKPQMEVIEFNPLGVLKQYSNITLNKDSLDLIYTPYLKDSFEKKRSSFRFLHNSLRVITSKQPYLMIVKNSLGIFQLEKDKKYHYLPYYQLASGDNEFYSYEKTIFGHKLSSIQTQYFYGITPDTTYTISLNERQKLTVRKNSVKKSESCFLIEKKNINLNSAGYESEGEFETFIIRGRSMDIIKPLIESYVTKVSKGKNYQLYSVNGSRFAYQDKIVKDTLVFSHGFNSMYTILEDVRAPRITPIKDGKAILIEENESGISSDRHIKTTLNGKFVINRYDPETKISEVIFTGREKKGTLVYRVQDRVGNSSILKVEIK